MLNHLKWPTLQERRHVNRLSHFHKIVHKLTPSIQLPSYILPTHFPTRQLHQHRFINPASSTVMYQKKNFIPNIYCKRMEQPTGQNYWRVITRDLSQQPYNQSIELILMHAMFSCLFSCCNFLGHLSALLSRPSK